MWSFIGLVTGIGLAEWADLIGMLIAAAVVCLVGFFRRGSCWVYVLLTLTTGFFYWDLVHPICPSGFSVDQQLDAEVLVTDNPSVKDKQLRFTAEDRSSGNHYRIICHFETELQKGDLLKVRGSLRRIEGPSNPGEFDFQEYFAHRGIFYNLIIEQPYAMQHNGRRISTMQRLIQGVVKRGLYSIQQNMGPQEAVLLAGMLFGFQGEISTEDFELFQKTGLVHIFSVSGFHVGFIVLLGTAIASSLKLGKRGRLLFVSGLILLYGFLAAWPVPLIRAAIMAWMGLTALYLGRDKDLLTSLAAAGLVILLMDPANLFEISFQLTFLATWGIIYLYPLWRESMGPEKWKELLLLSLAPQAAVLPLATYYYNMVSLISVLANILLVNLAGGAVVLAFIGIIIAQVSDGAASLFMIPAGLITKIVILGVDWLAKVPGGYLWVAKPEIFYVIAAYAGIGLLCWCKAVKNAESPDAQNENPDQFYDIRGQMLVSPWIRMTGYAVLALFVVRLLIPGEWKDPGRMKLVFLDVGQGDCAFIKTARGYTILIDGGGSEFYDVGGKVVLPYLRREGIRSLDLAITTHPHVDHIQGMKEVLAECPAAVVLCGQHCFKSSDLPGVSVIEVKGANRLGLDEATELWTWSPDIALDSATARSSAGNDISVLSRVSMGKISFLFTGDAGPAEFAMLDETGSEVASMVVKVPHHGSKYCWYDPFWDKQRPDYAVVSVGARNTFGHPSPTVLKRLEDKGIIILRTDLDGAITFLTDGQEMQVQTMCSKISKNRVSTN